MQQHVNLDIMSFVEKNILPRYNAFGRSHGIGHVQRVIANSLELARLTGADPDMAYVIAAYHDLGMEGPRAVHHITGGRILQQDARLRRWFSPQQIRVMKEAVEDHRASSSRQPRSIYGKIVAEADRDLEPETVFTRAVQYGLETYPEKSAQEQWERFARHMREKYSTTGYVRLWIPGSPNARRLREIQEIIDDEPRLRDTFRRIYQRETEGGSDPSDRRNG